MSDEQKQHGRWTVIRGTSPAYRCGSERARLLCRCVCGIAQPVFKEDLDRRRSMGCKSKTCQARWAAFNAMEPTLAEVVAPPVLERLREACMRLVRVDSATSFTSHEKLNDSASPNLANARGGNLFPNETSQ